MFYKTVEEFQDIVASFSVSEHRRNGASSSFAARINFKNGSLLHIKDYLFTDGKRKYSYQWQDAAGNLISRWDNSPHHTEISTFPHHRHVSGGITESNDWNIKDVLMKIRNDSSMVKAGLAPSLKD